MHKTNVLIVEDEAAIRDMISFALPSNEFSLITAENANQAEQALTHQIPQIILLDWMLPGKSGIDFIKWLKTKELYKNIPVILLTARAEEENKIKGLETGADDYITKPFSPAELIARIKTVLRRGPLLLSEGIIQFKNLFLNINEHTVTIDNILLSLTKNEYKLLHFFLTHKNRVYSREQLISFVWGNSVYIDDRTVDAQIRRLRNQLKKYQYHHYIKTIRGTGYQFNESINETS